MNPGLLGITVGALLGAIAIGLVIAARVRGRLPESLPGAALVAYVVLLWIYALAPAPATDAVVCRDPNLVTLPNIVGVAPGARGLLGDPAFQELVLNIALFVPFGTLLVLFFRLGVARAIALGFAASAAVEVVQLTGCLGLYPCAYRQFSLEDILLNTIGAALGALIVWLARRRPWGPAWVDPQSGRARSRGRRVLAIALDVATVVAGAVASIVFYRLVLTTGLERPFDAVNSASDAALGFALAVLAQAVVLLSTGRTIGEQIVDLRRRPRERATEPSP